MTVWVSILVPQTVLLIPSSVIRFLVPFGNGLAAAVLFASETHHTHVVPLVRLAGCFFSDVAVGARP